MYRPWGFPEWNPQEQKLFDRITNTIQEVFQKHNYLHIWTPAVEPVEVLKKWGDMIEQQVFGLYGMAQWPEDTKDYALHFDLTVPLARYVLDHRNDIVFPFSRYQMQPVRRWERTQRGRFKEFWQFDVDTIWPSDTDVGSRYDVQSLYVIDKAMQELIDTFGVQIQRVAKISHLWLTKEFLSDMWLDEQQSKQVMKVLDAYYKKPEDISKQAFVEIMGEESTVVLMNLIHTKDRTLLQHLPSFSFFDDICKQLELLGVNYEYDICIVRWQNYYSGMVVEWMDPTDTWFWSLAWWGRYDNLTAFIDPKHSFSGVWVSLWRFVYLLMERVKKTSQKDSYLFINFSDTKEDIIELYKDFLDAGLQSEIYPTDVKLAKQFSYADKKWFTYCVILWAGEKEKGVFALKDMKTWESTEWKRDILYGVIPVLPIDWEKKILIVQQEDSGHWCFPKWHPENWENPIQAAQRELFEEVWIKDISIDEKNYLTEKYLVQIATGSRAGQRVLKTVKYFVWEVKNDNMQIDPKEIKRAERLSIDQALKKPLYPQLIENIEKLKNIL